MRFTAKIFLWLLPVFAVGCTHKTPPPAQTAQTLAPPIEDAPPPAPPPVSVAELPPPVLGTTPPAPETAPPTPPVVKKPVRKVKKPEKTPGTPPSADGTPAPAEVAASPTTPSVSAIGQLSEGASGDLHVQTEQMIQSTEKGMNAITRTLNDQETKTAAQIREFLKQAHEALTSGDVDGAHTLAQKAKVLLAELNQ